MTLTSQQVDAIAWTGNLLLTACPGSGKTRTLIEKLVREIEPLSDGPRRICCITYTNTAVQEIEQRTSLEIHEDNAKSYFVSTIHGFCLNEIVRPYAWRVGRAGALKVLTRDNPDFETIAIHAASQVNYLNLTPGDYEAFENLSFDVHGAVVGLAAANVAIHRAAPHFVARCAELGYIDFGTIIYLAFILLKDHPRIALSLSARYAWFLVDEFQDTTELQIEILKLLHRARRSHFFMVGDLAQSIFGFTGARPELVAPFGEVVGARNDLSLSENFRSSKLIVEHAERLFSRDPPMTANGRNKDFPVAPILVRGLTIFQSITEHFLPKLQELEIPLGEATILAKDWFTLTALSRSLREFGTPIVGPGARPYRRSRLFASLAEQLCGAVTDPQPETTRQLQKALYHAIQDATGQSSPNVFNFRGRVTLVKLLNKARDLAQVMSAIKWLDGMSRATGEILYLEDYIDREQSGLFYASAQEMKADMKRQEVDVDNLTIDDLGLFASPHRALRLSTIHYAKGREYDAVAIVGLRRNNFPHMRAETREGIEAEKRLFYVAMTRARLLLMYVAERDSWGNSPSPFLGTSGVNIL